jgi:hypothetical protein
MKSTKLEELERQKAMRELRDCTFKPQVNAQSSRGRDKSAGKVPENVEKTPA